MKTVKNQKPKFKIGQIVKCPATLYNEKTGKITSIHKTLKEVDDQGNFISGGLCFSDDEMESLSNKNTFDGEILKIFVPRDKVKFGDGSVMITPKHTSVYKFSNFSYTVESKKMNTRFPERSLMSVM